MRGLHGPNDTRAPYYIPARDPLTAIPPSRHPFQFWVALACMVSGAASLFDSRSRINELLPPWAVAIWAVTVMLSGLLTAAGAFWRDRVFGLLLERLALTGVSLTMAVYGVSIGYVMRSSAVIASSLAIGIAIAAAWRLVHVNRELKVLRAFMARTYHS